MKRFAICALVAFTLPACLPRSSGPGIDWPDVVNCGSGVQNEVGEVSRILLAGEDVAPQLEDMAIDYGAKTVVCLVDLLVQDWSRPGAAAHPGRAAAAARGREFLQDTGTLVEREGEPGA